MNKCLIAAIGFAVVAITACNTKSNQEHGHEHNSVAASKHEHNHDHNHEIIKQLNLNNGEKWEMQLELMQNVEKMQTATNAYITSDSTNYLELYTNLQTETNALISDCTMQGESHNELHKWLEPHLAMLKDLKAAENHNDALPIITEIDASFDLLLQYFE